ncbi:MAG: CARDB domain-containing protein [Thermoleophilaceae bacterium]
MSFFDEPDDFSPRRTATAPRRTGGRGTDRQTIRRRQMLGAGIVVVVLILLFVGIKGCASIRKENNYKDYVREVATDVQQSQQQSAAVFGLLRNASKAGAVDVQSQLNGFRFSAAKLVDRARARSTPDELKTANRYLADTLQFRADGLGSIARLLPTALGDQGAGTAVKQMAAQMQTFLASDVIFTTRYLPTLYKTIKDQGLANDVPIPDALRTPRGFLPNIDWLSPTKLAQQLTGNATTTGPAAPGLHGTGLVAVRVQPAGTALTPAGVTDLKLTKGLSFDVQVQNQGQNNEKSVSVKLTISGAGKPISVEQQIDSIAAGETQTASVPLPSLPPSGRPVTIAVSVLPVPGEKKTDNNKQSYRAIFTAG